MISKLILLLLIIPSIAIAKSPIAIQPYDGINKETIVKLQNDLTKIFNYDIVILQSKALPKTAYYKERGRYRAEKLLTDLSTDKYEKVIGVTDKDISTTKGSYYDWGIFGLAIIDGKECVVSGFRFKNSNKYMSRLTLTAIHELGHTFGLEHCNSPICIMGAFNGIKYLDSNTWFCLDCLKKLKGKLHETNN